MNSTADLCDRLGDVARVCPGPWRRFGGRQAMVAGIATVRCFEDAGLVRQRLGEPGHGRILVVDAGASLRVAVLGDRMAVLALASGWAGVLVHGAVRDADALARLDIAVFALGTSPARGGGTGTGEADPVLTIQGVRVAPGDAVAMDGDGVVVVPAGALG